MQVATINYLLSLYLLKTDFNTAMTNYYTKAQVDSFKSLYLLITDFNTAMAEYTNTANSITYLQNNYFNQT